MFKVLVVDDEPMMLEGWRSIVDWAGHGYELCGVAYDGVEALDLVEKLSFDLLVTDIRMPFMDGLELIRTLQEEKGIHIKTVIVSGYPEFGYAQQAMRYQVDHYLLKPLLPDEIHRLLLELAPPLEEKRRSEAVREKETAAAAASLIVQLLAGGAGSTLVEASRLLGAGHHSRCRLIVAEEGNDQQTVKEAGSMLETRLRPMAELFRERKFGVWNFRIAAGKFGLLLIESDIGLETFESIWGEACQVIEETLLQATVFVSGVSNLSMLPALSRQVEELRGSRLPGRRPSVYRHGEYLLAGPGSLDELMERTDSLIRSIHAVDAAAIDGSMEGLASLLAQSGARGEWRRMVFNHVRGELLRVFGAAALEPLAGESGAGVVLPLQERLKPIHIDEAVEGLKRLSLHIVAALSADPLSPKAARSAVELAVAMLKREFRSRINIQDVAAAFGFHPVYFGQQFKRETGENFHTYIHRLRIEEAQRLLRRTDMKMAHIAQSLGYHDTDRFTAKFKAITGELPSAYKSRWLK